MFGFFLKQRMRIWFHSTEIKYKLIEMITKFISRHWNGFHIFIFNVSLFLSNSSPLAKWLIRDKNNSLRIHQKKFSSNLYTLLPEPWLFRDENNFLWTHQKEVFVIFFTLLSEPTQKNMLYANLQPHHPILIQETPYWQNINIQSQRLRHNI